MTEVGSDGNPVKRFRPSLNTAFVTFSVLGVLLIAVLCFFIVFVQDRNARVASVQLVESNLANTLRELGRTTKNYGFWDLAVENVITHPDHEWISDELGGYIYETGVAERALVIGPGNTIVFDVIEGSLSEEPISFREVEGLNRLTAQALGSVDGEEPVPFTGYIRIGDQVSLASAVRMTGYTDDVNISTDHVLVYLRRMDQAFLTELEESALVKDLRLMIAAEGASDASLELTVLDSDRPAIIAWHPDQPGSAMIPALLAGLIAFVLMAVVVIYRFNRSLVRQAKAVTEAHSMAERASQQKSEMLANVSHELRTPLNAIIGFADIMQHQFLGPVGNPRYLEYAGDIKGSGEHLLSLVNGLLDLSKIEAGKFDIRNSHVDIGALLDQTGTMVRHLADQRQVDLHIMSGEMNPNLRGDPHRLRQVILNLLSNALKFTPAGGSVIAVAAMDVDGHAEVRVTDTGKGIRPEDIDRVMEPFYQVKAEEVATERGTGLGLSVSWRLARLMGGDLKLDSQIGKGTVATLTLQPASEQKMTPDGSESTPATSAAGQ